MELLVENSALNIKQRIDLVKQALILSDIELLDCSNKGEYFHEFLINYHCRRFSLNLFIKNIANSGWADKPYIKRIQVPSLLGKTIPKKGNDSISLFLGIAFVSGDPIFVAWNPFSYVYHKTNRSCYVLVQSLANAFQCGLFKTVDCKKEVVLCTQSNFGRLIEICLE